MKILEVKDLTKKYDDIDVLQGISFDMEKGQTLSILGRSGSGKTTLLRSLNFLETPDSGTISVNGEVLFDGSGRTLDEKAYEIGHADGARLGYEKGLKEASNYSEDWMDGYNHAIDQIFKELNYLVKNHVIEELRKTVNLKR